VPKIALEFILAAGAVFMHAIFVITLPNLVTQHAKQKVPRGAGNVGLWTIVYGEGTTTIALVCPLQSYDPAKCRLIAVPQK
jgi:hypothetical protein